MTSRVRGKKKPVTVSLPWVYYRSLDMLVEEGLYANRNDAIRTAIHDLITREVEKKRLYEEIEVGLSESESSG